MEFLLGASLRSLIAFLVGFIFALGLGFAGMTQPHIVLGFLNILDWNPTLAFVMVGAIGVHAAAYPLVRKRSSPLLDTHWHLPKSQLINPRLFIGASIFGLGWGLGGFCPGPALTSLATGDSRVLVFVAAMGIGMLTFKSLDRRS